MLTEGRLLLRALWGGLAWPFVRLKRLFRNDRSHDPRWAEDAPPSMPIDRRATEATLALPGPHIVFTGLGLGEFAMIQRVVEALRHRRPDVKVSVALRHHHAIEHVRERYPALNVSWWPQDGLFPILRWLRSQRPDVVTLIEGYRQPFLVVGAARSGAKVALLNGRLRDRRSFHRPLSRPSHRWLFRAYRAMAMREHESIEILRPLVSAECDLLASGDLKTDYTVPLLDEAHREDLLRWLASDVPLVGAGSTDNVAEERMVLDAFLRTRREVPCRLLLAPRHPSALADLLDALGERGLTFSRRRGETREGADVLLLDSQGELANAYGGCVAAYVGGSYAEGGNGHNPVEPLALGVPVAFGPQKGHFEAIQRLVEEAGVAIRVADADALSQFWLAYLRDAEARERIGALGINLVERSRGAVERTVAMLIRLIDA